MSENDDKEIPPESTPDDLLEMPPPAATDNFTHLGPPSSVTCQGIPRSGLNTASLTSAAGDMSRSKDQMSRLGAKDPSPQKGLSSEQTMKDQDDEPKASFGIVAIFDALGVRKQSLAESKDFFRKFRKIIEEAEAAVKKVNGSSNNASPHASEGGSGDDQSEFRDFCNSSENDNLFWTFIKCIEKNTNKQSSFREYICDNQEARTSLTKTLKNRIKQLVEKKGGNSQRKIEINNEKNALVFALSILCEAHGGIVTPKFVSFGDTVILVFTHPYSNLIMDLSEVDETVFRDVRVSPVFLYRSTASVPVFLNAMVFWGLANHIALRGAVSAGAFIHQDSHILGPAVSDAVQWYEAADWIGLIATPYFGRHIDWLQERYYVDGKDRKTFRKFCFIEYPAKLKGFQSKRMWCASWPSAYIIKVEAEGNPETDARQKLLFHLGFHASPKGAENKYSNTVAFFDEYERQRRNGFKDESTQNVNPGDTTPES